MEYAESLARGDSRWLQPGRHRNQPGDGATAVHEHAARREGGRLRPSQFKRDRTARLDRKRRRCAPTSGRPATTGARAFLERQLSAMRGRGAERVESARGATGDPGEFHPCENQGRQPTGRRRAVSCRSLAHRPDFAAGWPGTRPIRQQPGSGSLYGVSRPRGIRAQRRQQCRPASIEHRRRRYARLREQRGAADEQRGLSSEQRVQPVRQSTGEPCGERRQSIRASLEPWSADGRAGRLRSSVKPAGWPRFRQWRPVPAAGGLESQ